MRKKCCQSKKCRFVEIRRYRSQTCPHRFRCKSKRRLKIVLEGEKEGGTQQGVQGTRRTNGSASREGTRNSSFATQKSHCSICLLQRLRQVAYNFARFLFQAEQKQEHFRKLQNFIQTQAKPPIFYLPAKHTLRTLELLKNTAKRVEGQRILIDCLTSFFLQSLSFNANNNSKRT